MIKNYILIIVFLYLTVPVIQGQSFYGLHLDNYSGSHNWLYNPSNLGNTPYRAHLNLASFDFSLGNSYVSLDRDGIFSGAFFDDPDFFKKYGRENPGRERHNLAFTYDLELLGLTVGLGKHGGAGFSVRNRFIGNIARFNDNLANVTYNQFKTPQLFNSILSCPDPQVTFHMFNEYAFSYGRVLLETGPYRLKVGGSPKLLQGIGSGYILVENDYKYLLQNEDTFDIYQSKASYGHSDNLNLDGVPSLSFTGFGFGLDLGAIFEFSPGIDKYLYEMDGEIRKRRWMQTYLLRTGISLTDIGSIWYKKHPISSDFFANRTSIPTQAFDTVKNVPEFTEVVNALFAKTDDKRSYSMNLPMMLNWFAEVQPVQNLVVSFSASMSLNPGKVDPSKTRAWNNYGLNIRFEHPWFGLGTPVFYNTLSGFNWGAYLKLGPLKFGSPNIFSMLLARDIRALGAYFGLCVPVPYAMPKDRDQDKVSNRKDKCPQSSGVWEFYGCPDKDLDHVQDSEDECPSVAGLKQFRGCPDIDNDGVRDKDDECPKDSGLVKFKGCPDRDNDEIIDKDDACPDQKGLAQFKGCPDTDADGIPDPQDRCPTLAGPLSQQGCPDKDGDGVYDDVDECVDVPGLAELRGCPLPDRDKDGLLDKDDNCPDVAGPIDNKGCPYNDQDNDGIPDKDDRCPTLKGVPENNGCPAIKEEVQAKLRKVFENLEFETGKAIIRPSSYPSLDELAVELLKNPDYGLLIEGHTDNVGSRAKNMTLSKNRANSVKTYLMKKGVPERRIRTAWYGPDRPIADNSTPEGRQKNRRVEFTIIFL